MRFAPSLEILSRSAWRGTVRRLSQLTTQGFCILSRRPNGISTGMSRTVVVTSATTNCSGTSRHRRGTAARPAAWRQVSAVRPTRSRTASPLEIPHTKPSRRPLQPSLVAVGRLPASGLGGEFPAGPLAIHATDAWREEQGWPERTSLVQWTRNWRQAAELAGFTTRPGFIAGKPIGVNRLIRLLPRSAT